MIRRPPRSTLFPYTSSSDLSSAPRSSPWSKARRRSWRICSPPSWHEGDRKSTRLNSSHGYISYAVFCLKKKKKQKVNITPPLETDSRVENCNSSQQFDCYHT